MGMLDKLMFWKKDEFDFGKEDFGKDLGLPGNDPFGNQNDLGAPGLSDFSKNASTSPDSLGNNAPAPGNPMDTGMNDAMNMPRPRVNRAPEIRPVEQPTIQQINPSQEHSAPSKDLELISVKLDSIRNTLEIMNQRIARIEKIAEGEQQQQRWV